MLKPWLPEWRSEIQLNIVHASAIINFYNFLQAKENYHQCISFEVKFHADFEYEINFLLHLPILRYCKV